MSRWADLLLSQFTDEEVSQLPRDLIVPTVGWSEHVNRLKSEAGMTFTENQDCWGFHDYIATLLIRDRVEKYLPVAPVFSAVRITGFVKKYDDEFVSFTQDDDDRFLIDFATTGGGLADGQFMADRWWWHRIPRSGPVIEDFREYQRSLPGSGPTGI